MEKEKLAEKGVEAMNSVVRKRKWKQTALLLFSCILWATLLSAAGAAAESDHLASAELAVSWLEDRLASACPMATYETEDPLIATASYTYENAVAALALMAAGHSRDAAKILDAFVEGMDQDVNYHDRFRNAYMAGDAASLPGYWNDEQQQWIQDAGQVGTGTKSSCAAAFALLKYYLDDPKDDYLNAAVTSIDWVIDHCSDDTDGYNAGYTGWEAVGESTDLTYKSTVDNLWMYAACRLLEKITGWDKYAAAADSAYRFLTDAMYASGDSRFLSGTEEDGHTPLTGLVTVEAQVLAALVLGEDAGLGKLGSCKGADGGYAYDNSHTEGSWLEGTAMAALAFEQIREEESAGELLSYLENLQQPDGAFPQTSVPELGTGELDRVFSDWPTVGATAWYVLAAGGYNPFA